ncbi:DNA-3-methyladenine glycosylase I, partial [Streptomyces griseofuscus]|uniref:DNA-3-methyladenine glycosylase I n=1 Tax=Streptomyces griseofuscus TaxID=146922 RepID=UPI0033CCFAEE
LKKRGLKFVGPTTAYALMQACGLACRGVPHPYGRQTTPWNDRPTRRRASRQPTPEVRAVRPSSAAGWRG